MFEVEWIIGFGIGVGFVFVVEGLYFYYCVYDVVIDVDVVYVCMLGYEIDGFVDV